MRFIPTARSLRLASLVLLGAALGAAETMPLPLELPQAKQTGTPKNIDMSTVDPVGTTPRPAMQVPAGTVLLSRGATVTASDMEPVVGELSNIVDGDKEAEAGLFVEFGPGTQWVQLDLGRPAAIAAIVVWHYHMEQRVYRDVVVQVADDAAFTANVRTLFNNDRDNSSGRGAGKHREYVESHEGRLIDGAGATARFVRLYSRGNTANDMNHYTEVEVFGRPAP